MKMHKMHELIQDAQTSILITAAFSIDYSLCLRLRIVITLKRYVTHI